MSLFNGLIIGMAIVIAHGGLASLPDRTPAAPATAPVHFEPAEVDPGAAAPLRVAGAWRVTSPERRMGGVSALALDRGGFLALSDSGVVIRLPRPGYRATVASFTDLPSGPGSPFDKSGRDSESLARDWSGQGWWVGFENRHSAYLFDPTFSRVLKRVALGHLGWPPNKGAEGAVSIAQGLLLFREDGEELVRFDERGISRVGLPTGLGRLSDAAALPDGRIVVIARTYGPAGFVALLVVLDTTLRVQRLAALNLGRLDDPEALALEPLPGGGIRLWVMTDNDFRRRVPTMLVALDWRG